MAATELKERAIVVFERTPLGKYAGKWTTVGRRGQLGIQLEGALHGSFPGELWSVRVESNKFPHEADEEIPAFVVEQKKVFVVVPLHLVSRGDQLSEEEVARIGAICKEQIGDYVVKN